MTTDGTAVVFGAGAVGRGIIAPLLLEAGIPALLVAATETTCRAVAQGHVRLSVTDGRELHEVASPAVPTVLAADLVEVAAAVAQARLVVVATGPVSGDDTARALAAGLARRTKPLNVLVCDNRVEAAARLREDTARLLPDGGRTLAPHGFAGVLVDCIARRETTPQRTQHVLRERAGRVLVDAHGLRAPLPPGLGVELVERFAAQVLLKLCVFSSGHAAAAYLGAARGHRTVTESLDDTSIRGVTQAAMLEGYRAAERCLGTRFVGGAGTVTAHLERFRNPLLSDSVARVGRNPVAKLGAGDRLCGPALLARRGGLTTPALVVAAGAAMLAAERLGVDGLVWPQTTLGVPHDEQHRALLKEAAMVATWLRRRGCPQEALERLRGRPRVIPPQSRRLVPVRQGSSA